MKVANRILTRYHDRLKTRRVAAGPGLTPAMPALLSAFLPPGRWLVVADHNTWLAQGRELADALAASGLEVEATILQPEAGRPKLVCETALVNRLLDQLRVEPHFSAVIAVGAGTICDTAKLAAAAADLPCAAVATAPSMNGYPSVIAAVLRDGVKRTEPTTPPILVLADLDTLCQAPPRMIAAGLADLLAKPVSTADWMLAHELLGDALSAPGLDVVEESAQLAEGIASALPLGTPGAVARLFEALFLSGLAMAVSGASSPASGAEHLISHYLDMTALCRDFPGDNLVTGTMANGAARGRGGKKENRRDSESVSPRTEGPRGSAMPEGPRDHDLHGLQVGVGTLVTSAMYRRLLDWGPASLDIRGRVAARRPWAQVESELRAHFGPTLGPEVIAQAHQLYAEGDALAARLTRFAEIFPRLRSRLAERLRGLEAIESELLACGAATRFSQIGVDPARALHAVRFAHHVRSRYTILHLLADLGLLEEWSEAVVIPLA